MLGIGYLRKSILIFFPNFFLDVLGNLGFAFSVFESFATRKLLLKLLQNEKKDHHSLVERSNYKETNENKT